MTAEDENRIEQKTYFFNLFERPKIKHDVDLGNALRINCSMSPESSLLLQKINSGSSREYNGHRLIENG